MIIIIGDTVVCRAHTHTHTHTYICIFIVTNTYLCHIVDGLPQDVLLEIVQQSLDAFNAELEACCDTQIVPGSVQEAEVTWS